LIGLGFANLEDALKATERSLPEIREIVDAANTATNEVAIQANLTRDARIEVFNSVEAYCALDGSNLADGRNETFENVFGEDAKDDLIKLNDTLNNYTVSADRLEKMNQSLADVSKKLHGLEEDVNDMQHHWLFIVATTFIALFDVVVLVFMYGVYSAWKNDMPRLFKDCASKCVLPLFIILMVIAICVSLGGLVGATFAADFCIDTPDNQVIDVLDISDPFNEFAVYYVKECDPTLKPAWVFDIFAFLKYYLILIDNALTSIASRDPVDLPCSNPEIVVDAIGSLQVQYNAYTNLIYNFAKSLGCGEVNEIYALIAHKATCTNGFKSLQQIFAYLVTIFVLSMTMITFRVAWYETEEEQDSVELKDVEEQAAFKKEADENGEADEHEEEYEAGEEVSMGETSEGENLRA